MLIGISLISCHKTDDISEPKSTSELLTQQDWKGSQVEIYENNMLMQTQPINDVVLKFDKQKLFYEHSMEAVLNTGSWTIKEGKNINIAIRLSSPNMSILSNGNDLSLTLHVRSLSNDMFSFKLSKVESDGIIRQYIFHFQK